MDPRNIEVPSWLDWLGHFSVVGAIFLVIDYVATWVSGGGHPAYGASTMQIFLATVPLTLFATWVAFLVFNGRKRDPLGWWKGDGTSWLQVLFGLVVTIFFFDFLGAMIAGTYWRITGVRLPFWDLTAAPKSSDIMETLRKPAPWPFPLSGLTTIEKYWAVLGPVVFIKAIVLGTFWGRSITKIRSS